jgi:hypothetical protein
MNKLSLPCNCIGGDKYCGRIVVYLDESGEIEINFKPKGEKIIAGVWLNKESKEKLIKFIK